MKDVRILLSRCRELGAEFIPQPDGKLTVRAPHPLPDFLRDELKRHKGEVLALLKAQRAGSVDRPERRPETTPSRPFFDDAREDQSPGVLPWGCPCCGSQVRLDPPRQEELPSRFWTCPSCSAWGATRAGAHAPVTWIKTRTVQ